jgi:hypothetical protein
MRAEDGIQKTIVAWLEAVVPGVFVFAIPNAARRGPGQRAGNAVPGLKKGMPDLCFLHDERAYFVEVKTGSSRRPSEVQVDCHLELIERGYDVTVATSIEDMREALAAWGIHTREVAHV